jgi:hypothetical protein
MKINTPNGSDSVKSRKLFILVFILVLILNSLNTCIKEKEISTSQQSEILDPTELAYLDNLKTSNYTAEDIILPNGWSLSEFLQEKDPDLFNMINHSTKSASTNKTVSDTHPFEQKNLLLAEMLGWALVLTDREFFEYPREGPRSPQQYGLAYSYGQKYHTERQPPPAKKLTICSDSLYGLDCSGLIYQLASNAGLTLSDNPIGECNAQFEADTLTWVEAFKKSTNYQKLHMEELGKLKISEILPGDLIFWLSDDGGAFHVGIVLSASDKTGLAVFMSSGCGRDCDKKGCSDNYSSFRGPRQVDMGDPYWFNKNYKVLRIKANMFPFKHVGILIGSNAIYTNQGKEFEGNFGINSSFANCTFSGNTIKGRRVDNYTGGTYIDSLEIEYDPVRLVISDFRMKRYVLGPTVGDYTHYERMLIKKRGPSMQCKLHYYLGDVDGIFFNVSGESMLSYLDVTFEYNLRVAVDYVFVVNDYKLKNLICSRSCSIDISFWLF